MGWMGFLDEGLGGGLPPTPFGYGGQDGGQVVDKRRGRRSSFSLGFWGRKKRTLLGRALEK
jgi:hypothetical protein